LDPLKLQFGSALQFIRKTRIDDTIVNKR